MLPSTLVSVYRQHKQDTDSVASWLSSTAKACGYPADLLITVGHVERNKHNKKVSRNKHVVATKDFVPLAEFIAASKKPAAAVTESSSRLSTGACARSSRLSGLICQRLEPSARAAARLDFEDAIFAFALTIDDLNKIRQEIRNIWAGFHDGTLELAAAAVATSTAIDLARNLADEIDPHLRPHGTSPNFFFDPKTYDVANSTFSGLYHMLDGFMAVLRPRQLPLFKPGHFGTYNPQSDRSRKTGPEKWQEDKILIMEACTELMSIIRTLPQWPVDDELLRGVEEMDETHKVPFCLVFAVQIYLDIHHLLRDQVGRGLQEMAHQTNIMRNDLKSHPTFHKNLKIKTWSATNEQVLTNAEKMIAWLGEDPVHQVKVKEYRKTGLPLAADAQKYYLLAQSPVLLSGLILYHYRSLTMMFEDRCVHSGSALQWIAEHVCDILSHSEWGFESSTEADGTTTYVGEKIDDPQKLKEIRQEKKNQNTKSCLAPPEKLVRSLAWALQGESLELAFPYLVLHRFCWKMLRTVKQECDPLLREKYTAAYTENETELPFVVGYILMANSGAGAEARDDRLLKAAAKVLNPFVDTAGKLGVNLLGKMGFDIEFEEDK